LFEDNHFYFVANYLKKGKKNGLTKDVRPFVMQLTKHFIVL